MKTLHKRLSLRRREDWMRGFFRDVELRGDSIALDAAAHTSGVACFPSVDSGSTGFEWGRVSVECTLPDDSMLRVFAYASDVKASGMWPDMDRALGSLDAASGSQAALAEIFGEPVATSGDFYVGKSGRYLWLMFELISTGGEDPAIHGVDIQMEGDHMVDYLPAIYQGDDFTRRFLSVFDSIFMDMERSAYDLPLRLDYENTDEQMLRYLASWVCVGGEGVGADTLRGWIATALPDHESMYTVEGVKRSIRRLTGREPIIIENSAVDPNDPACKNPDLYRRLYGDDPFRFFALLDEDTFRSRDEMEAFLERMKGLIPAGTELELVLLKRCVQLDWHTYLGINSIVSSYVPVMIDENTTIHYDTMIGGN